MLIGEASLDLAEARLVAVHRHAPLPALTDVATAVRDALETPVGFPSLRRALTPDDHVTIAIDETLTRVPDLLAPLLAYLAEANITLDAITLLCQAGGAHAWLQQLPTAFQQVRVEEHDPGNRKKLSYLASTRQGRRLYINRSAVDADQLVVLSRRSFDPLLGCGGAEGTIFPALSDRDTQQATLDHLSMAAPGNTVWPVRQEAAEVVWLLGAPFFVQVIEDATGTPAHIVGGLIAASADGQRLLEARWRVEVEQAAEVVIAEVGADPSRHRFADLAAALACASRVVTPEGSIFLLSNGRPELGPGAQLLRQADTPDEALTLLKEHKPADYPAAFQWASAAQQAKIYLLSRLPADTAEEMFTVPVENAGQVQRLLGDGLCLHLPDAARTLAVVKTKS